MHEIQELEHHRRWSPPQSLRQQFLQSKQSCGLCLHMPDFRTMATEKGKNTQHQMMLAEAIMPSSNKHNK
jgi:hypothetical protein